MSQISLLILRQMTCYLQSLLRLHQFPPAVGLHVYRLWAAISAGALRGVPAPHLLLHRSKKQSQSWRTESLQSLSGINRFDPYWKKKNLWEGRLWDITITEEVSSVCVGMEILSQESLLIWRSWSGKGSCSLSDLVCMAHICFTCASAAHLYHVWRSFQERDLQTSNL